MPTMYEPRLNPRLNSRLMRRSASWIVSKSIVSTLLQVCSPSLSGIWVTTENLMADYISQQMIET